MNSELRHSHSSRTRAEHLPEDAIVTHLLSLQHADGCWEGEMVWNSMILSQHVIVRHVVGRSHAWGERLRAGILRHYEYAQRADGSFGMHVESGGYVFF